MVVLLGFKTLKFMFSFSPYNFDCLELHNFIKSTPIKSIGNINSALWKKEMRGSGLGNNPRLPIRRIYLLK